MTAELLDRAASVAVLRSGDLWCSLPCPACGAYAGHVTDVRSSNAAPIRCPASISRTSFSLKTEHAGSRSRRVQRDVHHQSRTIEEIGQRALGRLFEVDARAGIEDHAVEQQEILALIIERGVIDAGEARIAIGLPRVEAGYVCGNSCAMRGRASTRSTRQFAVAGLSIVR